MDLDTKHKRLIEQRQKDEALLTEVRDAFSRFKYKQEYDDLLDSLYAEVILEQSCKLTEILVQEFMKLKQEKVSKNPDRYQADIATKISEACNRITEIFRNYESVGFDYKYKMKYPPSEKIWNYIRTKRLLEIIEYYKELQVKEN